MLQLLTLQLNKTFIKNKNRLDDSLNARLFLNDTASSLTGRCEDIPATVLYQFVYTDDNYLNGSPVSEILAAKIRSLMFIN